MNLLFVHDHPFYLDESGAVHSGGGLPSAIWNNYLQNFEKLYVFGRLSENIKDKKVLSSHENVEFILTKNYDSIKALVLNYGKLIAELKDNIRKVDIVLVRLPSVLGIIAGELAVKQKKAIWVEQVGNAKEALSMHGSLLGKLSALFFEQKNKKLVQRADYVLYVTKSKLQNDYPTMSKITVSLSDVIIKKILRKEELDDTRFFGNYMRIGLIGGFDAKYKGQDILLRAIAKLKEEIRENIIIDLVGKGDYGWIMNLVSELKLQRNIGFVGALEAGDAVNDFLSKLSLYVQPSMTEGMPRATIEAMALGCPVIGSNAGGIPDIVTEDFVHNKGDVLQLSGHIDYLFLNRSVLKSEALLSLDKSIPYLKENLENTRKEFYSRINEKESQ